MAGGISITVKSTPSISALMRRINKLGIHVQNQAQIIIEDTTQKVANDAKTRVPRNDGRLASSIISQSHPDGGNGAQVGTDVTYGKWQEFGTARMGSQTVGFGFGLGDDVEGYVYGPKHNPSSKHLIRWVQKKGLGQGTGGAARAAYMLAKKIKKDGGLKAQPFLLPAWNAHEPDLAKNLLHAINSALGRA